MEKSIGDFLLLLSTIDPIGTLSIFVAITAGKAAPERRRIALRCVAYSAAVLVASIVVGQVVLGKLGIQLGSFQLAGGIVLFLVGVQMVFGAGPAVQAASDPEHDVAIFPLAVPSIASPGSILAAVVLTDNTEYTIGEQALTAGILLIVLALTLLLLLQADRVYRVIGKAGSSLLVRVLGLVLASLAVEMAVQGILDLLADPGGV